MFISIEPPCLRANQNDERHAIWLESLYDLVFAVTVFDLAERVIDDPTLGGFMRFGLLFLVLW